MPPVIEHPPVMPATKHEFRAPMDLLEHAIEARGITAPALPLTVNFAPLLGTWNNVNKTSPGLVKVVFTAAGVALSVHVFGACVPTPCDWGLVPAKAFADGVTSTPAVAFSAQYKFNFKETLIVGRIQFGALFVETFNHFTDGSGRADYNSLEIFSK